MVSDATAVRCTLSMENDTNAIHAATMTCVNLAKRKEFTKSITCSNYSEIMRLINHLVLFYSCCKVKISYVTGLGYYDKNEARTNIYIYTRSM